jgi:hypothetical protein
VLPAWTGTRRPWGSRGTGEVGCRRALTGAWPAWMGTRRPCHSQDSGAGAGAGGAGGAGKELPQTRRAREASG